jgi:hypothetical protein
MSIGAVKNANRSMRSTSLQQRGRLIAGEFEKMAQISPLQSVLKPIRSTCATMLTSD